MAGPANVGANATNTDTEKNEKIIKLVNRLIDDTNLGYEFETPVNEYGYLQRPAPQGINGANFAIREDVIAAQKSFFDTVKDATNGNNLTIYENNYKAQLDAIENAYIELHKTQGNYIDGLLRGANPDMAKFKQDQKDAIDKCNTALATLKTGSAQPPLSDAEKKALDKSIAAQQTLLNDLSNKVEKDRDHLLQKLENHRQRNMSERADQEIHQEAQNTGRHELYIKNLMFSLHNERDAKYQENEDLLVEEIRSKATNNWKPGDPQAQVQAGGSRKDDLYQGYMKAKKIITDEIKRAETTPPHESWFSPFGRNEKYVDFAIHRYKGKDNEWHIEPQMLRGQQINTKTEFRRMMQTMFDFQRFAGCEKDSITLSYDSPVYGKGYANERVDQIIETINLLKQMAKKDITKAKSLYLDDNARSALFAGTNPKKIQQIRDGLKELERLAEDRDKALAQQASKEIYDAQGAKITLSDEVKNFRETKVLTYADGSSPTDIKNSTSALHTQLIDIESKKRPGALALGHSSPVQALIDIAGTLPPTATDADKENKVKSAYRAEFDEIDILKNELKTTQQIMEIQLDKLSKLKDYSDPVYIEIEKNLKELEQKQRELFTIVKGRCEKWLEPSAAAEINSLGAPQNAYISGVDYTKFKDSIQKQKDSLDILEIALDKNKDDREKISQSIADEVAKEDKQYKGLR
ncbi:MAG: hypothetical protein JO131_07000 [Gammaproteobacteria bacterium]|nr:hypothetical protein [Gammaproteobacteria bacterium]